MFIRKNELSTQELAYSELLEEIAKDGPIFKDYDVIDEDSDKEEAND